MSRENDLRQKNGKKPLISRSRFSTAVGPALVLKVIWPAILDKGITMIIHSSATSWRGAGSKRPSIDVILGEFTSHHPSSPAPQLTPHALRLHPFFIPLGGDKIHHWSPTTRIRDHTTQEWLACREREPRLPTLTHTHTHTHTPK